VAYFFLRDAATGSSTVESEWISTDNQFPGQTQRLLTHIERVEASNSLTSAPLRQAQRCPGQPDLYWWDVRGVGAFYHYDGTDLVIVLVGAVLNPPPPSWGDLLNEARRRI
jgi:hypothetical protein